jgi:hypothetical protein
MVSCATGSLCTRGDLALEAMFTAKALPISHGHRMKDSMEEMNYEMEMRSGEGEKCN